MTDPSEKDRERKADMKRAAQMWHRLPECTHPQWLAQVAAEFAAIRADEAVRIAKDAAANMEFLGVPEQSAEVERLRGERDEARQQHEDAIPIRSEVYAERDAALARAEAAEGQRDALRVWFRSLLFPGGGKAGGVEMDAICECENDRGVTDGHYADCPLMLGGLELVADTESAATARDARLRAEAMEEAAKIATGHSRDRIRSAIAPPEVGK